MAGAPIVFGTSGEAAITIGWGLPKAICPGEAEALVAIP